MLRLCLLAAFLRRSVNENHNNNSTHNKADDKKGYRDDSDNFCLTVFKK